VTRRVEFEAECACGETHVVAGWESATPGLVVYDDGRATPCGIEADPGGWGIWHLPGNAGVGVVGFEDPESAMRRAHLMGEYRDFSGDLRSGGPTVWEITNDLDRRGLL
jgi:hypothetical protein